MPAPYRPLQKNVKVVCTGTFALPAGRYVLFCNLLETEADGSKENHYANGMRAGFESRG
jgi:hypothetical protein